jgi:hypothetical protein
MADGPYHKVGTTFRTSFVYLDNTGTAVTGLTSGSFTIELAKDGTGNQSTTGITLAEIDATHNAGEYSITVSGTTGFASATGEYELVTYRTATPSDRWSISVRVTSDGTGTGTWGVVAFTAVASNGRVMSGGTPLSGATVRVVDSSGNLYAQALTDASGLWGTIYFNANGTYTAFVQKSSYTTTSGTITVTGLTTATGPGTDLSITASAASSSITAGTLWSYARRQYGDRTGSKADTEIQQAVDDAIWMLCNRRSWPWLHTAGRVNLNAAYNTGSIAVTNGSAVVTLTAGTWPTWAASGELYVQGLPQPILSRDSGTQLTLVNAWGEATASGLVFIIAQHSYSLPGDCQRIEEIMGGNTWPWGPDPVSAATLEVQRTLIQSGLTYPALFAIRKDQLLVWPFPSANKMVNLTYFRRPASLVNSSDVMDFDPLLLELVRRAIDYQVSIRGDCVAGTRQECLKAFEDTYASAAPMDRTSETRPLVRMDPYASPGVINIFTNTITG